MSAFPAAGLNAKTIFLLIMPPLMWAGNAVVGRLAAPWVPPMTLNFLRWALVLLLLLPLAGWVLKRGSSLWSQWRRFLLLGLLSVGLYNTLQYLALQTSSPVNVTLVASSMPIWMLVIGRLFFAAPLRGMALVGAGLSLLGVTVVLTQGQLTRLQDVQLVPGDLLMLLAAMVWAVYSWLLTQRSESADIRSDWAAFLMAQTAMGLLWCALFAGGEWLWLGTHPDTILPTRIDWGWPLALVLLFVAVGPSLVAYRAWNAGVQRAGPTVASFFSNLTPLFAALLAAAFLGEPPRLFHAVAFALIVLGIVVSSARR
ncbi:MAG: DMT family transporter [Serpentinimonas sp.]|jgi:drug/metabolite transporter (DMT)-like permease|nr:DMT family transporter [Serpentinimonas sp.]